MKKIISLIIAATLILGLASCAGSAGGKETTTEFDMENYKSQIMACVNEMDEVVAALSTMATYQGAYLEAGLSFGSLSNTTPEKLYEKTKEFYLEKYGLSFDGIVEQYENICSQYREIINITVSGYEAETILANFTGLFSSLDKLYTSVTYPTTSYSSYANSYNEYIKEIKNYKSMVTTLIPEQ